MNTPIAWEPKVSTNISVVGPDWYEMARRHLAKARSLQYTATTKYYGTDDEARLKADAAGHFRIAQQCQDEARRIRHIRDYGRTN